MEKGDYDDGDDTTVFKICLEVLGRGEALRKDWPVEGLRGRSPGIMH